MRQDGQNYYYLMDTYYVPGTMLNTWDILFHPVFTETNEVGIRRNPVLEVRTLGLRERW